jgi:hypothetical protein
MPRISVGGGTVLCLSTLLAVAMSSCMLFDSGESAPRHYPVIYGIAEGGGQYVAVGDDGVIVTSTDGKSWTLSPAGVTTDLRCVAYFNDRFVVGGVAGDLLMVRHHPV